MSLLVAGAVLFVIVLPIIRILYALWWEANA